MPAGQGGGPIAGVWSGYINAPEDGFYDIMVVADTGAKVSLSIGGVAVPGALVGNVWSNQGPISLTAGALTPIVLTVTSVKERLWVSWKSLGRGCQVIPGEHLYASTLVERLGTTYVRFLKATSLANALSLTANEIAWLGTARDFGVNTSSHDKRSAGSNTFTPESMANIKPWSALIIDSGSAQEMIDVKATTDRTFSTNTVTVTAHAERLPPSPS